MLTSPSNKNGGGSINQDRLMNPPHHASEHQSRIDLLSQEKTDQLSETLGFRTYIRNHNSLKNLRHPVTGEEITINAEDLMRNTHKSPFQNSVRDQTNYYFKHQKALENYLNIKAAAQKTMNRRLKIRNSYMTIFPEYGLHENKKLFRAT